MPFSHGMNRLVTSWQTTNKSASGTPPLLGGNTSIYVNATSVPPFGYGVGVTDGIYGDSLWQLHLNPGNRAGCSPGFTYGQTTPYQYGSNNAQNTVDNMTYVLGTGWQNLLPGDTVTVKMIDVPSGKVIYQQNVPVTGDER